MSDIREVQLLGLEILKEVVRVCEQYNIKYYLSSGTLLGAVRHKGFIPWDNDVDIEMPVEDYRRFLKIAPKELPERFFVQTYRTDIGYNDLWAKVRLNGTTSLPIAWKKMDIHWGIGIDIFPMIGIYDNHVLKNFQFRLLSISRMLIAKDFVLATNPEEISTSYKLKLIYKLPAIFRVNICKLLEGLASKKYGKSKKIAQVYMPLFKELDRKKCEKSIKIIFEGVAFSAPENYDYILTEYYGDYMTPPPMEERNGHEGSLGKIIYDCSKDYKEYL